MKDSHTDGNKHTLDIDPEDLTARPRVCKIVTTGSEDGQVDESNLEK